MLKQGLQQKLLQKLSPQQIQLIKLLEVPTILMEQRIKKELEENPTLEEGRDAEPDYDNEQQDETPDDASDDVSIDEYLDEDIPSYKLHVNNYSKDDKKVDIPHSSGTSFHEHLTTQLGLRVLKEEEEMLATYIIGNIDGDGYLRRDLEAIVDDLAFALNISTTERDLLDILDIIQDFDPAGVGARSLQECLLIQVKRKISNHNEPNEDYENAFKILKNHFEEFTKKHYEKIQSRMNISDKELKDAVGEILKLNPKPGSSFSDSQSKTNLQIIPDFIMEITDGKLQVNLNSKNAPELRLSKTYTEMLEAYQANKKKLPKKDKETVTFVKQKLDSAKWFIDAIKQRQNTLMHTMDAIVAYQREYFNEGDETKLRPMILKDIAEKTQLDISTISRVANSKYIQTHFGIMPLKYFFSEGMQTESGEEVSTREIKKILQDCIGNESKKKPLTDEKLAKILQEKGYQIARRTVAKYREQLNISVARLRKEL